MTRLAIVLCVMSAWLLGAGAALAGPFEVRERGWEGCSSLLEIARAELGEKRVVVRSHFDWSEVHADDAVLLLHPEHALAGEKLAAFLAAGGRAAVIDDFGAGDRILERFQIERVPAPTRPLHTLRRNRELAVAEPVREPLGAGLGSSVHPTVENVERLITNHPSGLRNSRLTPVLKIRTVDDADVVLALAGNFGTPPRGKLFAMGDPSALMNQMLRYPGNRAFAVGLIHYLADGAAGESAADRRLFLVANRFSESGSFGAADSIKGAIDERLESIGQELRRLLGSGLSGVIGLALAAFVAFGIGLWTTSVSSRVYRRRIPSFARQVPVLAQGGVAGRAAVLAAPSTPPSLVILELKHALEEGAAHALGLPARTPTAKLLDDMKRQKALDERHYRVLKGVLLEMANVETLVAAGQARAAKRSDAERLSRLTFELLSKLRERGAARPAA